MQASNQYRCTSDPMPKGQCRVCNHCHWYDSSFDPFKVYECAENKCNCSEENWIPKDNLKFMEWRYNKCMDTRSID